MLRGAGNEDRSGCQTERQGIGRRGRSTGCCRKIAAHHDQADAGQHQTDAFDDLYGARSEGARAADQPDAGDWNPGSRMGQKRGMRELAAQVPERRAENDTADQTQKEDHCDCKAKGSHTLLQELPAIGGLAYSGSHAASTIYCFGPHISPRDHPRCLRC